MKKKSVMAFGSVAICLVAILAFAGPALGGWRVSSSVILYRNSSNQVYAVQGALGAAHNSADPYQFVSCTYDPIYGSASYLECDARDSTGAWASCFSYPAPANLLTAFTAMTSNSWIEFDIDPNTGACTNLFMTNSSIYPTAATN